MKLMKNEKCNIYTYDPLDINYKKSDIIINNNLVI